MILEDGRRMVRTMRFIGIQRIMMACDQIINESPLKKKQCLKLNTYWMIKQPVFTTTTKNNHNQEQSRTKIAVPKTNNLFYLLQDLQVTDLLPPCHGPPQPGPA